MAQNDTEREPTLLETPEEIRQALAASDPLISISPPAFTPPLPDQPKPDAMPFRPLMRPPLMILCVCDDGEKEGELIRLRNDHYVIGRTEGDIQIPHDGRISSPHAELRRHHTEQGWRWLLVDLGSSNGTFTRMRKTTLKHGAELLIGAGLYRFEQLPAAQQVPDFTPGVTQEWSATNLQSFHPSFVEIQGKNVEGERTILSQSEYWIGRDAVRCQIARPNDRFLAPQHARLVRDASGQWSIHNHQSLNGVWLRVDQMWVEPTTQFQLGEQRFVVRMSK